MVTDVTLLLTDLDERGVSLWKSPEGWYWATQSSLKAAAPKVSDVEFTTPATGPFARKLEAINDAHRNTAN